PKIKKTTKPTSGLSPITNEPNVSTTPPASALDKIDLVVETFNPRRNNVSNNNKEGKIENCNGCFVFIETNITMNAREILHKICILNNHPGNGMINIIIIKITANNTDKSLCFIVKPLSSYPFYSFDTQTLKFQQLLDKT